MLMARDAISGALCEFIVTQTDLCDASFLLHETDLFAAGVMDSFMVVSLAAFCDEQFGTELPLLDLAPENFRSITTLTELVTLHQREAAQR